MMTTHLWPIYLLLLLSLPVGGNSGDSTLVLAVIVHKSNPIDNLSKGQLRKILLGDVRQFSDNRKVVLAEREPESNVYECMLLRAVQMKPAEYKRHLMALEFQGKEPLAIKVLNSDDTASKFVFNVPNSISVIEAPASAAAFRAKIVRIDGKLPGERGYGL